MLFEKWLTKNDLSPPLPFYVFAHISEHRSWEKINHFHATRWILVRYLLYIIDNFSVLFVDLQFLLMFDIYIECCDQ